MFRLLVTNVCGLMSKFGEFCYTVHTHSLDIVIATESKRTEAKMTTQETVITGYTAPPPLRRDRTANGGGVIVWVRQGMFFRQLNKTLSAATDMKLYGLRLTRKITERLLSVQSIDQAAAVGQILVSLTISTASLRKSAILLTTSSQLGTLMSTTAHGWAARRLL